METEAAKKSVRVLHLEDNENDHALVAETLRASQLDCEFAVVTSREEFEAALRRAVYDLIISDFTLPSYDGLSALSLAQELHPETPFVFFSGTIGEDIAVDSLKHGAVDYVLKQRPNRLAPAIRRALRNADERARLKQAESALHQMEERFRIVARATNDVIWEWDVQNNRVWFSENFQTAFGHQVGQEGIASERWFDFIHPDDRKRVMSGISTLLASGGKVWWSEHRLRRADDSCAHIFDRASIIYDSSGKPQRMVGVKIDMSERKHAEEKIREQAALIDEAQDAIVVGDLQGRILFWSKGAERIYGWTSAEALGRTAEEILKPAAALTKAAMEETLKKGRWIGELRERDRVDGEVIAQSRWTLLRDAQGDPASILVINTDITERKQLEEQFLRAQRLESLGALVSGIAHDLNNALTPVLIGVQILREQKQPPDNAGIIDTMEASIRRGADMVQQVLAFARGGDSSKTLVRVDQLVREMEKIINSTFQKNIDCRIHVDKDSSPVFGSPTQLHQVLMNLCVNARDAMPGGGTITLAMENVRLGAAEAARHPGAKPGNYLCAGVADTGEGIPSGQLKKLFQPFFTTKEPGKGTGLGLSTSLAIVKNHGGFMTVTSEAGCGSEFKLFLPAVSDAAPDAAPEKPSLPAGNGECILIIDDEEAMLALIRTTLENYGYRVIVAASGPEAVVRLAEKTHDVNLVITDIEMPFMDGFATIKALRKLKPAIKIIIATGSRQEKSADGRGLKTEAFIYKPFTTEKLLTTIHKVLKQEK